MNAVENPIRQLAAAVIEQAVSDYISLRELGAVTGTTIDTARWNYEIGEDWRYSPLGGGCNGYNTVQKVRELIEFLSGRDLDLLCDFISTEETKWQACRIRKRIGLVSGDVRLAVPADLWWQAAPENFRQRQRNARDGRSLSQIPLYNTPASQAHDDDESREAA